MRGSEKLAQQRKFYIVCGHYGCGKSNFSINLAMKLAKEGRKVMMLDLDLVNPYFLSSGYKDLLSANGIRVISPIYANTNVDIPALPAEMNTIFETDCDVVMDVGGDDAGSTVLGRFRSQLNQIDYQMIYLINQYRNLTVTPEESVQILREIEAASRLKATQIINNSHLKQETTWEVIANSLDYAKETAQLAGIPLTGTTIPKYLMKDDRVRQRVEGGEEDFIPLEIYVKAPWEYPEFTLREREEQKHG